LKALLEGHEDNTKVDKNSTGASIGLRIASRIAAILTPETKGIDFESIEGEGSKFFFLVEDKRVYNLKKTTLEMSIGTPLLRAHTS
jgi:hypothetical protein